VSTADLVAWLRGVLDENEAAARELVAEAARCREALKEPRLLGTTQVGWGNWTAVERTALQALADIEAKRAIVDAVERYVSWEPHPGVPCDNEGNPHEPCDLCIAANRSMPPRIEPHVLLLLAMAYADRPGYRTEWRLTE